MKELAACLAGGFSAMPANHGAMTAWYQSGFPPPGYICTSSAGGIEGAIAVQWHEPTFIDMGEVMINLRKRQFAGLHPKIRNRGIATILATCGALIPTQQIEKIFPEHPFWGKILRYATTGGVVLTSLLMQKKFIVDTLFHSESFLVYDNLINLLISRLSARSLDDGKTGFERIFSSKIKIELLSANINKAGWMLSDILTDSPPYIKEWKEKGWVSKTNFRPQDTNLPEDIRNSRFVIGIVDGARIWSIFNAGRTDEGDSVVDTAVISNLPFHPAINEGYDKIVLFYHNRSSEGPTDKKFESLLEITFRANDLIVAGNTRKIIYGWFRVNSDLVELKMQMKNLEKLKRLLDQPDLTPVMANEIESFIASQEESYRKLTYYNKKIIRFCIPKSDPLPRINFARFNSDDMMDSMNRGARAFQESLPQLEKMYQSA